MTRELLLLKWGGVAAFTIAALIGMFDQMSDKNGVLRRAWDRYCGHLDRKLRSMFIWTPGTTVALGQAGALALVLALAVLEVIPLWWAWALAVVALPPWYIENMRQKRIVALESQLDGFLMALANSLKATPSLANAMNSVPTLLPSPFREEVELVNKEMKLGASLDDALIGLGSRVGSKQVDTALSAILIGRQLGGDLPKTLETTAESLREMARLEGVVKTKTAEGKAQMWVLALFPFVMAAALNWMQPGYFIPLQTSVAGWAVAAIAGVFWLASLLVARRVLRVDL